MTGQETNESTIRQYLLGSLDENSELSQSLEERLLIDSEFSQLVDLVEDEIIQDYLEEDLDPLEQEAVEKHFLRPPERREKLRTARMLSQHLVGARNQNQAITAKVLPQRMVGSGWWRTSAGLASAVLLIAAVIYSANLRRGFESELAQKSRELSDERQRSASLGKQLDDLRNLQQPSMVMLSLFHPAVRGAKNEFPEISLGTATQQIHVEIGLPGGAPNSYEVRLETLAERKIWSSTRIPFVSDKTSLLIFDMPSQSLEPGDYQLVVSQPSSSSFSERIYPFRVVRP
jgi:hypothetical protein